MGITTFSSREFNQDASRAKRAAIYGPVFITDRGRTAHVLLSIADYERLAGVSATLLDAVTDAGSGGEFDFDPPRLEGPLSRPADLG